MRKPVGVNLLSKAEANTFLEPMLIHDEVEDALELLFERYRKVNDKFVPEEKKRALIHLMLRMGLERFFEPFGGIPLSRWNREQNMLTKRDGKRFFKE